jgi:phosphatidate cytidylyltransferase
VAPSVDDPAEPSPDSAVTARPVARGRNLPQAIGTALVLLALIAGAYLAGPDGFFVLALVVIVLALFELLEALKARGRRVVVTFELGVCIAMLVAAYLRPGELGYLLAASGLGILGTFILGLRRGRGTQPATDVAWAMLPLVWVGGTGAAAVLILTLPSGLNLLVAHVLITALSDIGAFFTGTSLGRHKMAPAISPAKSWEGFAGGLVASVLGGAAAGVAIDDLGIVHGVTIGIVIGLLAPAGDLSESMVKRELGIKDSGRMLPGHGGMLDRLDAILFCAPAVLVYLRAVVF